MAWFCGGENGEWGGEGKKLICEWNNITINILMLLTCNKMAIVEKENAIFLFVCFSKHTRNLMFKRKRRVERNKICKENKWLLFQENLRQKQRVYLHDHKSG